ncbi:MAG: hypothetical protein V4460_11630 [Pseudomonadota bacterium]
MTDPRDVTGVWYGRWTATDRRIMPNSFIATLQESASLVSGTITEPDREQAGLLRAIVDGTRTGGQIEFTKTYDGSGRLAHSVEYSGTVNAPGTEIAGLWRLAGYSGRFSMTREQFDADALMDDASAKLDEPVTV